MAAPLAGVLLVACTVPGTDAVDAGPAPSPAAVDAVQGKGVASVSVYLVRAGTLERVARQVPNVPRIGAEAVKALLAGPSQEESDAGTSTEIPEDTRFLGLVIDQGVATIDLSREFEAGGSAPSLRLRLAQVVCTLDEFDTVAGVRLSLEGSVVGVLSGGGVVLDRPVDCGAYGAYRSGSGTPAPAVPGGVLLAFVSYRDQGGRGEIYVMGADGSGQTRLTSNTDSDFWPAFAPGGRRIAFVRQPQGANGDVFAMDADGSNRMNLTDSPAHDGSPAWSPDGARIAFVSDRDSSQDVYVMDADGSDVRRLTYHSGSDGAPAWSPDGARMVFRSDRDGNDEIYVMDADAANLRRLTDHPAADGNPAWSPDGTRIVFRSDRDGNDEIYVMGADGSDVSRLTGHPASDGSPVWSPDGTRIAFRSNRDGNDEIYVMDVDGSDLLRLTNDPASDRSPSFARCCGAGT